MSDASRAHAWSQRQEWFDSLKELGLEARVMGEASRHCRVDVPGFGWFDFWPSTGRWAQSRRPEGIQAARGTSLKGLKRVIRQLKRIEAKSKNSAAKRARRDAKRYGERAWVDPVCIECDSLAEKVTGAEIYPHRPDLAWRTFYRCCCGAFVGTHRGTEIPLGRPAGPATRLARNDAHRAFDTLWERKMAKEGCTKHEARNAAYAWLAQQLGIEPADCHIALFDTVMCRRVIEACTPYLQVAA